MKLHDLKPTPGSHHRSIRVGRGIAAGKGKTAGRGTKGQKSRAGASIPAWFEGGQTPIHVRVPKLRGFKRRGRIDFQVVNIGRISAYAEAGRLGGMPDKKVPVTVNPEIMRAAGLITKERRAVKVLGSGDCTVKLFVMADAFTAGAREKIEAAGGSVQALLPERAPKVYPGSGSEAASADDSAAADAAEATAPDAPEAAD